MKKGFTLAEVLITLAIIGVVAALTVPNLIAGYNKKVMLTSLQNTYNAVKNAVAKATVDQDADSFYDTDYYKSSQSSFLRDYLGVKDTYTPGTDSGFVQSYKIAEEGSSKTTSIGSIISSDLGNQATCALLESGAGICLNHAKFLVDVNGVKPPNKIGEDLFWFAFDRNGKSRFTNGDETIGNSAMKSDCMKQVVHAGWKLVDCNPGT